MSNKISDKSTREWLQLHKKLYLLTRKQVHEKLGEAHTPILPLEKRYHKELQKKWKLINKENFIEELHKQRWILLGDFHALQQSQRGHLRILRELYENQNTNCPEIILAVEFFQAKHQSILQKYLRGQLSEKKFLEKIKWNSSWGFPWSHYLPLINWVRQKKIPLYGINWGLNETRLHSLKMRDHFSAVQLQRIAEKHPKAKIVIIYGELHLLNDQLPFSLRHQFANKQMDLIRVFQNFEPYYFQLAFMGLENKAEYLKLSLNDFCIMNIPPWVKWQNYLMFLEQNFDRDLDDPNVDFTDHIEKQISFLEQTLKVKVTKGNLSVDTVGDESFFKKIQNLSKIEHTQLKKLIALERSLYIPQLHIGYLAKIDINHMAALASEYVHSELSYRKNLFIDNYKNFLPMIWIQAIKYFGNKLINHKRKTDTLEEIQKTLFKESSKENKKYNRGALLLVLQQKVREVSYFTTSHKPKFRIKSKNSLIYWEAARLLGGMLGEKIFLAFRRGQLKPLQLQKFLTQKLDARNFEKFYYEQIKKIENLPMG